MPLNNTDNLLQSVIMVDANGNRAQNSAISGPNRQAQKLNYALPQNRFFAPGVPQDINMPGSSANSVPWMEHVQAQPQPAGLQAEMPPRVFISDGQQVFEDLPQQQFRPRSVLVQEAPAEQRYHYPAPNFG